MAQSDVWDRLFEGRPISASPPQTRVGRRTSHAQAHSAFRPDIQGLRAFAVVMVVANHFGSGWLDGGFVGVDIFFVISGFLITSLLIRETDRRGRISFLGFYQRRIRRILPAAITTLLAVDLAAHLVFNGARVRQTVTDEWWAAGFAANIHFSRIGTDYFQANRAPSLVQHFWSLAVEEQFYIVWPIVLFIVLSIVGRPLVRAGRLGALLAVIGAGTIVSFVYAVHETDTAPTKAYFSTFARAWELGVGATIAIALAVFPRLAHVFGRWSGAASLLGVAGIVVSAFVVKPSPGFPAPWAALPVVAAGLVILAGAHGPGGGWTWPLTNRLFGEIGLMSYSLYLWHWPAILVCEALVPRSAGVFYPMTLAAIAALTIFSYYGIESPFHKTPVQREAESETNPPRRSRAVLAAAVAAVFAVGCYAWKPIPQMPDFVDAAAPSTSSTSTAAADPTIAKPSAALTREIRDALDATSWPAIHPSLDDAKMFRDLDRQNGTCINPPNLTDDSICTFGQKNAASRAVVVGDSISTSWLPAVKAALLPQGYAIRGVAMSNCPFNEAPVTYASDPSQTRRCNADHRAVEQLVARFRPTLLIVSDTIAGVDRLSDGKRGSAAVAEWAAGQAAAIQHASTTGTRVVVLSPPPPGRDVTQCYTAASTPADCVRSIPPEWYAKRTADLAGARAAGATYVDDSLWFCSGNAYCPVFAAGLPMRSDTQHISNAWARHIAPELARALKP